MSFARYTSSRIKSYGNVVSWKVWDEPHPRTESELVRQVRAARHWKGNNVLTIKDMVREDRPSQGDNPSLKEVWSNSVWISEGDFVQSKTSDPASTVTATTYPYTTTTDTTTTGTGGNWTIGTPQTNLIKYVPLKMVEGYRVRILQCSPPGAYPSMSVVLSGLTTNDMDIIRSICTFISDVPKVLSIYSLRTDEPGISLSIDFGRLDQYDVWIGGDADDIILVMERLNRILCLSIHRYLSRILPTLTPEKRFLEENRVVFADWNDFSSTKTLPKKSPVKSKNRK